MKTSIQFNPAAKRVAGAFLALLVCLTLGLSSTDSRAALKYYQLTQGGGSSYDMSSVSPIWETQYQGERYNYGFMSSLVLNIGFTFKFNGTNYTQVRVYSTGVMTLGTGSLINPSSNSLGAGMPLVAPFWDELKFTGAQVNYSCNPHCQVRYRTTGIAPNRVFIAEWTDMELGYVSLFGDQYNGANRGTFQAQLHENGNIVFVYQKMEGIPTCGWIADSYSTEATPDQTASIGLGQSGTDFLSVTPTATASSSFTASNDNVNIDKNASFSSYVFTKIPEVRMSTSPKIVDYGTLSAGAFGQGNIVVSHVGIEGVLNILSTTITGPSASQFSVISTPGPLNPGQQANLVVRFTPTLNGTHTATLTISSNGVDSGTQTILLSGRAVAPTIEIIPIGSVNTATRMFKKTRTQVGDSLTQSFLVKNIGEGTLVIYPWSSVTGQFMQHYSITRWPLYPVGQGNTDTMSVTFAPTQDGGLPARLELYNNATNGTQSIDLYGVGVVPAIALDPSEMLTFDSVPMGTTACKMVRISNPGTDTLRLTNNYLSSSDGDFSYTPLVGADTMIAPGAFRDVTVCITPLQKGTRRARLRFTTNIPLTFEEGDGGDGGNDDNAAFGSGQNQQSYYYPTWIRNDTSAKSVEIWANAVPSDATIIAMGDFSDGVIGSDVSATATFTNMGSELITVEAPFFSGANASNFKATKANFPLDLAPGANISFVVVANPKIRGENTAVMNIANKSEDRQYLQAVNLTVKGLLPSSTVNETVLGFDKLFLGEESSKTVTVTNTGDIDQVYTATITGAGFTLVSDATSDPVMSGSSVIYTVKFAPEVKGVAAGALTLKSAHIADMSVVLAGDADEKPVTQAIKGDVAMKGFVLSQNSPNPATGKTSFSFTTPSTSDVRITLADITGKTVLELANGVYGSGAHRVELSTNEIASGSYVYILESEGVRLVRQMVITK